MDNLKSNGIKYEIFWGKERHELIAALADGLLSEKAQISVKKILEKINQTNLRSIAVWADEIKRMKIEDAPDNDTKEFLTKFKDSGTWHYVNLPLDAKGYSREKYSEFTSQTDVVQMTIESIHILLRKANTFSEPNALRWLVHLIGDIHQPVHVGCGYIQVSTNPPSLMFNPEVIIQNKLEESSDQGGNLIILPNGKKLHSFWDTDLPLLDNDTDFQNIDQGKVEIDELNKLPIKWASESLIQARTAYQTLKIIASTGGAKPTYRVSWDSEQNYINRCILIIKKQKELAASRLAFVLNAIYN